MKKQNVLEAARKMSAGGFQSDKAAAKIEQGFVDGDVIPMSAERCIRIEGDKATGYKGDTAENSFNLADMPAAQLEQLMAAYIVKHYPVAAHKVY